MLSAFFPLHVLFFNLASFAFLAVLTGRSWADARTGGGFWCWAGWCLAATAAVGLTWGQVAILARAATCLHWTDNRALIVARVFLDCQRVGWPMMTFALSGVILAFLWRSRLTAVLDTFGEDRDDADWPVRCDVPYGITGIPAPWRDQEELLANMRFDVTVLTRILFWLGLLAVSLAVAGGIVVTYGLVRLGDEPSNVQPGLKPKPVRVRPSRKVS